ncbi:hypothetical protein ACB295_20375 [Aeromonas caviae]|uniref:hypothetical protein n=1 Tax=Aeromonas TaxID=642 RepID=UPI00106FAEA0|nr:MULTISPECIES: hypothetical protein [Aeromonas]TFF76603.1 hypothetical protein DRM95_10650 [Aeromonas taiwanensis]
MDEFIQEGKYATHETLKGYACSWQTLSLLTQEVITNGMYVPEFLPDVNQPVLLVVIKEATVLKAKSLHSEAPEVLIAVAAHTGESFRDDDEGYYADYWRLDAGTITLVDCAEHAVFWLPLPAAETWEPYRFSGYGTPFDALSAPLPVFQHLAFVLMPEQALPDLGSTIYLKSTI